MQNAFRSVRARRRPLFNHVIAVVAAVSAAVSLSRKVWSIVKPWPQSVTFCSQTTEGKIMLHLIWYIVVGLIAGIIAKSVLHVHMTIFWTIVLGIIGSIIGGAVTHLFSPSTGRFHPAGIIFSTLGAILVLYLCIKLHIRFPRVL
jgi:uncharacterized membrane protein YeaQ/YmgE (transglycosylase-associated protein family)